MVFQRKNDVSQSRKPRLKMKQRTFATWWIICIVFLTVLSLAINVAASRFSVMLDSFLGAGTTQVERATGSEEWDAQYYKKKYGSLAEAVKHSKKLAEQVSNEGIVLLKNDGVLPLKKNSTVTPYGYAYANPAYSGTGAASTGSQNNVSPEQGLEKYFKIDKSVASAVAAAKTHYPDAADGTPALDYDKNSFQAKTDAGKSARIYEYDRAAYEEGAQTSSTNNAAVVFISRNGSEGLDKRTFGYDDGTAHYLALTQAEKDMIRVAKEHSVSVTVVLNTANPMEVAPLMSGETEVNAIVWMGTAGSRGFKSLGNVLSGAVNPSGRLTDIYATDFTKDPTFANFGEYGYSNVTYKDTTLISSGEQRPWPFVEYEEGVYVGYKYYETAAVEDPQFVYGQRDVAGASTQVGAVAYPFGYGLSYTTFEQKLNFVRLTDDGKVEATVTVKNTGSVPGKEVVQLYATAPYTDYDRTHGVEKPATQLVDFDKTRELKPGESQDVDFTFAADDLSSYDRSHKNADDSQGAYLLEAGKYAIELKNNSHDVIASSHINIAGTTWFEGNNPRSSQRDAQSQLDTSGNVTPKPKQSEGFKASHNQFEDLTSYMNQNTTQLSRANWNSTQPSASKNRTAVASEDLVRALNAWKDFDVQKNPELGNVTSSAVYEEKQPVSGQDNGLSLINLRGVPYDDPQWDKLMDQLDFAKDKESIQRTLFMAAYQTDHISSIGKPLTIDKDGAMGWSNSGSSGWPSANVMASTYNKELLTDVGEAFGEEALHNNFTGWYAPAINIHRSPFGGRVYEYYSEDPVVSGKLAAAAISGAGNKGVVSYLKHFAINDQETNRSNYMATWANEQAAREVYLRAFEIAVESARSELPYLTKDGKRETKIIRSATAMMSAQNNIGAVIGFGRYSLQTAVLRGEWGFDGVVVTDMFMETLPNARDLSMRSGSNMYMIQMPGFNAVDYDSATARTAMRRAIKNVAYATANSNAMNNITPGSTIRKGVSAWQKGLWIYDGVIVLLCTLIITWIVRRGNKAKARPDLFKQPRARKAKK